MEKDQIKNTDSFKIFKAGLAAVSGYDAVFSHVKKTGILLTVGDRKFDLSELKNIYIVGAGKAAGSMAKALESILGDQITEGVISVKYDHKVSGLRKINQIEAGHPIPDKNSLEAAKELMNILRKANRGDLVISVFTGGGSALLASPADGLSLESIKKTSEILVKSGAKIQEINTVRKHLSSLKGGQMAELAYPAEVLNLMLSDVVGDNLDAIASGPFIPDSTTFSDSKNILEKYNLWDKIPENISKRIKDGLKGEVKETPKEGNEIFENIYNVLIGTNKKALEFCAKEAEKLGYETKIITDSLVGETKKVAKIFINLAKGSDGKKCFIVGGETVVFVRSSGLGGRNAEMALVITKGISGLKNIEFLSCGTDGTDGPTDAAGAICDGDTMIKAKKLGLDIEKYIENNNSYRFFEKVGGLVKTGPTNTNVNDIQILLLK